MTRLRYREAWLKDRMLGNEKLTKYPEARIVPYSASSLGDDGGHALQYVAKGQDHKSVRGQASYT